MAETHGVDGDFYRCKDCRRLLTQPELRRRFATLGRGGLCPACGCLMFVETNPRWYEYAYPRVVAFALARCRELGLRGLLANARAQSGAR